MASNGILFLLWGVSGAAVLAWTGKAALDLVKHLHILQLEGYKTGRFLRWVGTHRSSLLRLPELLLALGLGTLSFAAVLLSAGAGLSTLIAAAWLALAAGSLFRRKKEPAKKPLVFTWRAIRLYGTGVGLLLGEAAGLLEALGWFRRMEPWELRWPFLLVGAWALSPLAPLTLAVANVLINPLERAINAAYWRSARRKMQRLKVRVIGITGSYGKTSTKFILQTILAQRFKVLKTPESYNTPMGLCKVIRGQLSEEHEFFIAEMGAYRPGDIRSLCRLVKPQIGILTAVGPMHLERFKTLENVARTKFELIESLPPGGLAIFNADNPFCRELAEKARQREGLRVFTYALEHPEATVTAGDLGVDERGTRFTVRTSAGETALFQTRLLGRHNVSNILAATVAALECGLSLEEIRAGVAALEPVPHRLQLLRGAGGVTVIDDAFNSNPVGARNALEVLAAFHGGQKILVTPGMIELGERQEEENRQLGVQAAQVCDAVILVGPHQTAPLRAGLEAAGFPAERVTTVKNLTEATRRLQEIARPGDTVLFENDLPDTYAET
jgi:UDP-N-acetylmuramoyl-tripeptide--D-alanyl-D-alanine ligase